MFSDFSPTSICSKVHRQTVFTVVWIMQIHFEISLYFLKFVGTNFCSHSSFRIRPTLTKSNQNRFCSLAWKFLVFSKNSLHLITCFVTLVLLCVNVTTFNQYHNIQQFNKFVFLLSRVLAISQLGKSIKSIF